MPGQHPEGTDGDVGGVPCQTGSLPMHSTPHKAEARTLTSHCVSTRIGICEVPGLNVVYLQGQKNYQSGQSEGHSYAWRHNTGHA